MNIHEYQAKEILRYYGVGVPIGHPAFSKEEAAEVARNIGNGKLVVKAQIHAGGRGKAGGVKLVDSPEEVEKIAEELLGKTLVTYQTGPEGQVVKRLYVEAASKIKKEYYLSAVVDRDTETVTFIISAEGGVEIEEVAKTNPEKIHKVHIKISRGFSPFYGRKVGFALGLSMKLIKQLISIMEGVYTALIETDAAQIEINPLAEVEDSDDSGDTELIALDAKINFDSSALFRRPNISALRDMDEEDSVEFEAENQGLNYVKMEGEVGCLVNGAGLAMATMDIIKHEGSSPANFLDIGGSANSDRVEKALRIIMSDSLVKVILVNIFGGIVRCDMVAEAVISAVKNANIEIPLVVRLSGTNSDLGMELIKNSGLNVITATDLGEAAKKVVEAL